MTGRDIVQKALNQEAPPRVPVALIAGGEWYVYHSGQTFAGIRDDPNKIAQVYIKGYQDVGHDLMWSGAGLLNYPVHCLGCPIKDKSSDSQSLTGQLIASFDQIESLDLRQARDHPTMKAIIKGQQLLAETVGRETMILPTQWGPSLRLVES